MLILSSKGHQYPLERSILLRGLGEFAEREQLYAQHRSDIRFVQYNQLSQNLAFDARLMETIRELTRDNDDYAGEDDGEVEQIDLEDGIAVVKDILEQDGEYFKAGSSPGSSCEEVSVDCEDDIYRQIDGRCNNLRHSDWGAAGRVLLR